MPNTAAECFQKKFFLLASLPLLTWINQRLSWPGHSLDVEILVEEIGTVFLQLDKKKRKHILPKYFMERHKVYWENHEPAASHWQDLSHNVVSKTPRLDQNSSSQL